MEPNDRMAAWRRATQAVAGRVLPPAQSASGPRRSPPSLRLTQDVLFQQAQARVDRLNGL